MTMMEATADALVAEPVQEEPVQETSVEKSEDNLLSETFDKAQNEATEQPETKETTEEQVEEKPAETLAELEVPQGLPEKLRGKWGDIPEEAREAIISDRDGLHRRLSDMGRQVQGITPIRDVLVKATKEIPALSHMKPEQAAEQIFDLAKVSQQFSDKPVETVMGLIEKHGLKDQISQALQGHQVQERGDQALLQEITQLKQQIGKMTDPDQLRQQVTAITAEERVAMDVNEFARQAEHWAELENVIPLYIPIVKQSLGENAAHVAVLKQAHKMALENSGLKAQDPTPVDDPEKAQAALKAKSVNVTGKASGKPKPLTEDEALSAAFDRAQKR